MNRESLNARSRATAQNLFIEQGDAFMALEGRRILAEENGRRPREGGGAPERERFDVVVIGAGQAGLSVGYHLARRGLEFVILEANERVGDAWRRRWDSLRLFTPARFDALDGLPFPARNDSFPTKDEMADYLEGYAAKLRLPVRTRTRVESLSRRGGVYVVEAGGREIEASHVVVAAASYQRPRVPSFAAELDPAIVQIHSSEYRNPSQLRKGPVLLVGAGNSGAEIAIELAREHRVWLAGRDVGHIPFRIESFAGRRLLARFVLRVLFHRVLTVDTPIGRRLRPKLLAKGGPLLRQRPHELEAAGVERVPRVAGAEDGRPRLVDGRLLDAANVIWCTGFGPGLDWIHLPVIDEHGEPKQDRGVACGEAGLYFVGLHFEYAMSSVMIHGVGRDARRVAEAIAARMLSARRIADAARYTAATLDVPKARATDAPPSL
ncbi:MAG TPA: FAD-dependent oxidoreductase [Gammaproteobacteria bacterium]|nr:FAD-dependent oxidoreductase [Gammaproteobacteria bacterium]